MAESSTSVRLLQHHLRQSGMLLATGQLDAAAAHLDAALAIDPASLAALALRERLTTVRGSNSQRAADPGLRANAPISVPPEVPPAPAGRFVPSGVDAASWTDFEQRVQQRRFRALIEAGDRAITAGDLAGARGSVEEARELQPDSLEVARLSIRIAAMPMLAAEAAQREGLFRSRTFRAAGLLLLGVSLLMGLDWVRSGPVVTQTNNLDPVGTAGRSVDGVTAANEEPAPPSADLVIGNVEPVPDAASVEILSDVPVVVHDPVPETPAEPAPRRALAPGEIPDDYVPRPASRIARNVVVTSPVLTGEIPDNYVAPSRRDPNAGRDAVPSVSAGRAGTPSPIANVVRQPATVVETLAASPGATTLPTVSPAPIVPAAAAGAAAIANGSEISRVESVLHQYARAYGRLDVSAVRAVYPSVNERALAKAFSDLSSQSVSFDNCSVNIQSSGASAKASCHGTASYVGKVGSQDRRTEPRTVQFELKRNGDAWKIEKAQTGR